MNDCVHVCTAFDRVYLMQGWSLWRSIILHEPRAVFWVLALDEEAAAWLENRQDPRLRVVRLQDLYSRFPELLTARNNRSRTEFIFTLTPFFPRFLLETTPNLETLVQVDADMAFFASPQRVVEAMGAGDILIVEHGFPDHLRHLKSRGRFNVGVQVYRNGRNALNALRWWSDRCLEFCGDSPAAGLYADQGYLDEFPARFTGVVVCDHPGVNLAPWNWSTRRYAFEHSRILVNGRPLIVYHYARFLRLSRLRYASGQIEYGIMGARLRRRLHEPYARLLENALAETAIKPPERLVKREDRPPWRTALVEGLLGATWWRVGGWWWSGRLGLGRYSSHLLAWWRFHRPPTKELPPAAQSKELNECRGSRK